LEGRKVQSYVEGVTVCLSSHERGIMCREEVGRVAKGGEEAIEAFRLERWIPETIVRGEGLEYRDAGLS
jgi:hypothetical protein